MYNFIYDIPTKVLFGGGQLNHLHEQQMPGKKALVVISNGKSTKVNGYLDRLYAELDQAGVEYVLFDEISPNPTKDNVNKGAQLLKQTNCDFVVALGGGSVMDAGKSIALVATNSGNIWDYSLSGTGHKQQPKNAALPIVAITTTAGTGSEVDCFAVISNEETEEKSGFGYKTLFPTISVVDFELMMTVPPKYTAFQGMDAFYHAAESIINKNEHPMGEMFALKAIELLTKWLPIAYKDGSNREARSNVALANSLAGYYMLCTSEHTMEHALGSYSHHMPHGAGLIMISHEYFKFFADKQAAEDKMIKMAIAMGKTDAKTGQEFIDALDTLIDAVGMKNLKMSDYGITTEIIKKLPKKLHEVVGGDTTADPLILSDTDILGIYERSFH